MKIEVAARTEPELQVERPLLRVENLVRYFPVTRGVIFARTLGAVKAVDGINLSVLPRETLGIVGESGCGKSTLARLILRLDEPTAGKIFFEDRNIFELKGREMKALRRQLQIIFQDPYSSLHPRLTAGEIIAEPLAVHGLASKQSMIERVHELLGVVGLSPYHAQRYPHEFSGGQRQRIGIARALATQPKLIVCDEPVSALDVSIRAQVINLLQNLQERFGFSYIMIAHDLSVIKHISQRVAVMYLGKVMELADKTLLFSQPLHPYTQALLSAMPIPDPLIQRNRAILRGDVPSPLRVPPGCRFHTRCSQTRERCRIEEPVWTDIGNGHFVACHFWREIDFKPILIFKEQKMAAQLYLGRLKRLYYGQVEEADTQVGQNFSSALHETEGASDVGLSPPAERDATPSQK